MGMHMDPQWDEIPADDDDDYIPPPTKRTITQGVVLNAHPPKPKAQIAKEHRKRALRESIAYDMRLEDRYDELEQWYEELLEDEVHLNEDELPNADDGARLFAALATRNDARAGIHDDSVGALEESALARARMYTFDVRSALAALLPPPPGPHKDTRAFLRDTLARPTALFACAFPECRGDHGFEWPEINYHWREQHRDESVWVTALGVTQHRYIRAKVWTEGVELANRILDVVGLPRDTTMHQLDKLCKKRRLGCACGDPYLQEESPVWGRLVRHVHDHLKMDKCRRPCDGIPWINDHSDLESCIKLLPKGANTKAAFAPTSADSETIAYVEAFRAKRPAGSCLECLLCEAMLKRKRKKAISFGGRAFMLPIAEELVYHMQAKHGIPFDEKNVAFRPPYSEPPPEKTEVDLRRFCLDSASDF